MTRYTINIGDDFPLGNDAPGERGSGSYRQRRQRHGLFLRVLFFLAVAAIVLAHPIKTLLVVGVVLLLTRSPRFGWARERLRAAWHEAIDHDWRREVQQARARWQAWRSQAPRGCCGRGRSAGGEDESDRYRGFV